jgi:hypothetical protein
MRSTMLIVACLIPHLVQSQTDNLPRRTVTGTVVNGLTGEPIRRALVSGGGEGGGGVVFTGPDGRFRFENVPDGPWAFFVKRPGFLPFLSSHTDGMPDMRNYFTVTVTPEKNDFQLKLYPTPRISGHVGDENGEPVEGVRVQLTLGEVVIGGYRQWRDIATFDHRRRGSFPVR